MKYTTCIIQIKKTSNFTLKELQVELRIGHRAHLSSALYAAHEAHVSDEPRERQEEEQVQVEAAHVVDALSDVQRAPVEEVLRATPAAAFGSRLAPRVQHEVASAGRWSAARPHDVSRQVDIALRDAAARGL